MQMDKNVWHIPRPSLASSGVSQKSSSRTSSIAKTHSKSSNRYPNRGGHKSTGAQSIYSTSTESVYAPVQNPLFIEISEIPSANDSQITHSNKLVNKESPIKRGSQSSQGSSNASSHSASSGSLLLTTANLKQFSQIHKKLPLEEHIRQHYHLNITLANGEDNGHPQTNGKRINDVSIPIDSNFRLGRAKEYDTMSIASSTHFTMVNGIGGPQKVKSGGICRRGQQITVLIVTMSLIFLIGILGAVYFLELRAQKMMAQM